MESRLADMRKEFSERPVGGEISQIKAIEISYSLESDSDVDSV